MTSKEALDILPELMLAKDFTVLDKISNCFNVIYDDLDTLEKMKKILRENLSNNDIDTVGKLWEALDEKSNKYYKFGERK